MRQLMVVVVVAMACDKKPSDSTQQTAQPDPPKQNFRPFSREFQEAQARAAATAPRSCDQAGMRRRERWLRTPSIKDCVETPSGDQDCKLATPHQYGFRIEGTCGDVLRARDRCDEEQILELARSEDGFVREFRAALKIEFRTYLCEEVDVKERFGEVTRRVEVPLDFILDPNRSRLVPLPVPTKSVKSSTARRVSVVPHSSPTVSANSETTSHMEADVKVTSDMVTNRFLQAKRLYVAYREKNGDGLDVSFNELMVFLQLDKPQVERLRRVEAFITLASRSTIRNEPAAKQSANSPKVVSPAPMDGSSETTAP